MTAHESRRRALVVGLDGATLDLVEPWARAGKLPVLAGLMQRGAWARLRTVLPAISPSAWASFLTGVNPGRHGVFDFTQREPGSYRLRLTHFGHNRAPALWRMLNAQGRRAIVMNVPTTWPPDRIEGALVSGLGTPDFRPFTYPESLGAELRRRGYRVNLGLAFRSGREDAYLRAQHEWTRQQVDGALWLLREQPWDVFCYVIRGTDDVAHHFWKHMDATYPGHDPVRHGPWRDALLDFYRLADQAVGELAAAAGPDTVVFVVSDHGMGPQFKDVYLNEWLRQQKYLVTRPRLPAQRDLFARAGLTRSRVSAALRSAGLGRVERIIKDVLGDRIAVLPRDAVVDLDEAVDWDRTRAYSIGYHGQIYLNVRGREPRGTVESGAEYEQLRGEIMERLGELRDPEDGATVVTGMYRGDEVYSGAYVGNGPDILVIMRDLGYITRKGYELGGKPGALFGAPVEEQSSSHRVDGLVIAAGPGVAPALGERAQASIMDVVPTLFHLIGAAVPRGLDGRVLGEWFDEETRRRPVGYDNGTPVPSSGVTPLTEDEEAEVTARLRDLGYLG